MHELTLEVARIAAQLARQPAAQALTAKEIAADALALYRNSLDVRKAPMAYQPEKPIAVVQAIANRYHARLLLPRDPHGMCVGLKFDGAPVSSGFQNAFFVA